MAPGIVELPGDPDEQTRRVVFPQRSFVAYSVPTWRICGISGVQRGVLWLYLEGGHRVSVRATPGRLARAMGWLDE